jgi:NADPH:quinone reductase-like Zn-dependent oxidoreductase
LYNNIKSELIIFISDVWIRKGLYSGLQFNSVLGSDGVGIVQETSRNESSHLVGQQVIINPGSGWEKDPIGPENEYRMLGLLPLPGKMKI